MPHDVLLLQFIINKHACVWHYSVGMARADARGCARGAIETRMALAQRMRRAQIYRCTHHVWPCIHSMAQAA